MGAAIRRGFDFLLRQSRKLGRIDFEDEPRSKVVGIMQLLGLVPQSFLLCDWKRRGAIQGLDNSVP
jgi:hypothetical protein